MKDKMSVLFAIKAKPRKFIYSTIILNFLLSVYTIIYLNTFFLLQKCFEREQLIIIEGMNILVSIIVFWLYFESAKFSVEEPKRILTFYFYFKTLYFFAHAIFSAMFISECLDIYSNRRFQTKSVTKILVSMVPLVFVYVLKLTQQVKYYFAIKSME
jgi:hypothetical protein